MVKHPDKDKDRCGVLLVRPRVKVKRTDKVMEVQVLEQVELEGMVMEGMEECRGTVITKDTSVLVQ